MYPSSLWSLNTRSSDTDPISSGSLFTQNLKSMNVPSSIPVKKSKSDNLISAGKSSAVTVLGVIALV